MARWLAAIVIVITSFSVASPVQAQFGWVQDFSHSVVTDFKRNNCWPQPFVCPDRITVRAPFNIMVHNGWELENTIGDHHFGETGELTEAARNKIYWIFTQAPEQHRVVYVRTSRDPAVTAQRLQAVQEISQAYAPEGTFAHVEITTKELNGWTAERVGFVSQAFEATAPPPRLPSSSAGTTTGN